ncbi:MAG: hypothetical protein HYR91_06635 [Flavobacteriia bacterium]|nr:hypothetical protein [Flavobacteriia bacterium]
MSNKLYKIIFSLFWTIIGFIQPFYAQEKSIFVGIDGGRDKYYTFVEIQNETAFIEVMTEPKSGLVRKLYEENIPKGSNTFTPYKSDRIEINADITKITFSTIQNKISTSRTVELRPFLDAIQVLDAERNKAYFNEKTEKDIFLLDSIIGKGNYLETEYYSTIEAYRSDSKDASMSHLEFKNSLNHFSKIALDKIINRDREYIQFLKAYIAKNTYTKEDIDLFIKKASFTKLSETEVLTEIIEKSGDDFLIYIHDSKILSVKGNVLLKEIKDLSFSKLKKPYHDRVKKALHKTTIHNGSKHLIKKKMKMSRTKRIIYRTVPIIGYGVAIYFIVTLI